MPDLDAYRSVVESAGWVDRSSRPRIEIGGPDRAKFLHNLVTNDIKRLPDGKGVELFVTSPQGKAIAYGTALAADPLIVLRTDLDALEVLLPHLRKYGVFDDVTIEDATSRTFEYHLAGPKADAVGLPIPSGPDLGHTSHDLNGSTVRLICESPTGRPGLTVLGSIEAAPAVRGLFERAGVLEIPEPVFEALRIEAGTPVHGKDVTIGNLPQEVGRDDRAINFVKGCYLGQETVARLDALGHVNRILKGIRVEGLSFPVAGAALTVEGKVVGSVTSSAFSEGWNAPIGLAYVKVTQAGAGTVLNVEVQGGQAPATVLDLPMLPPSGRA